jgi:Fic family protein
VWLQGYDISEAVGYHYGQFPPKNLDYQRLLKPVAKAAAAIAHYDAVLRSLHNSELLLAPLRSREAVISSRMEGTIATLDEILRYEAEDEHSAVRMEVIEVLSYRRALNHAQRMLHDGIPISGRVIRETHGRLMLVGRGASTEPGVFKREQNYIVDRGSKVVQFIPVDVANLEERFRAWEVYINDDALEPLIQTAVSHVEFEAIHPFKDGNGRLGRMLITLMLWAKGLIAAPHLYVSEQLEQNKDEYVDRMRKVSQKGDWTGWCEFFLRSLEEQADKNLAAARNIRDLHEQMKDVFRKHLSNQWFMVALDFVFKNPIFRNSRFTATSGIPPQTAHRITSQLAKAGLLTTLQAASGRRPALYAFEPLLAVLRT